MALIQFFASIAFAIALALLPPCTTEDADGLCGWNADTAGNGGGTSFIAIPGGGTWYGSK